MRKERYYCSLFECVGSLALEAPDRSNSIYIEKYPNKVVRFVTLAYQQLLELNKASQR